ncbi:MAG: AraC family transcriptional regulator [Fusicatenibacter sp.]|nr:AraC family transcriptional regulator [Fusicatenibacter sp.]
MITFVYSDHQSFEYDLCGKFQAPSKEWMHLTRELTNFELMVVTSGTLYIADQSKQYEVKEGEYLLMPPGAHQHGYRQGSCSFYWLHFLPSENVPEKETPRSGSADTGMVSAPYSSWKILDCPPDRPPYGYSGFLFLPLSGHLAALDRVIILMKQLQDTSLRYHNPLLCSSLTCAVLCEISCQSPIWQGCSTFGQKRQILQDLISYVQYHSSENLKVSTVAAYFGYSEKYLSSLFRSEMGMTLKQFIQKTRMDSAMAELTDTNHPISQIAYNVGFQDAHNFSNAFRKVTGMTPGQYRKGYASRKISFE